MEPILSPHETLSEDTIHFNLSRLARALSNIRKSDGLVRDESFFENIQSSHDEMVEDWLNACNVLNLKILDGSIKLTDRVSSFSFWRLEESWITEIKSLIAYYIWKNREDTKQQGDSVADYFEACRILQEGLIDKNIKASPRYFERFKEYIEDRYLYNGKIDLRKNDAHYLISKKASKIYQNTGSIDHKKNWEHAEIYTKIFYENIIPAVMRHSSENIASITKAFEFSENPENHYQIINCFELGLVTYFIDFSNIEPDKQPNLYT